MGTICPFPEVLSARLQLRMNSFDKVPNYRIESSLKTLEWPFHSPFLAYLGTPSFHWDWGIAKSENGGILKIYEFKF